MIVAEQGQLKLCWLSIWFVFEASLGFEKQDEQSRLGGSHHLKACTPGQTKGMPFFNTWVYRTRTPRGPR